MRYLLKKVVILALITVLLPLWSCLAENDVFLRIDRDDPEAWKQELANRKNRRSYGNSRIRLS